MEEETVEETDEEYKLRLRSQRPKFDQLKEWMDDYFKSESSSA